MLASCYSLKISKALKVPEALKKFDFSSHKDLIETSARTGQTSYESRLLNFNST